MFWRLWEEFLACPVYSQFLVCAFAVVVVAGLTVVSIILALHPTGVGAVLAFLSGLVVLFLRKKQHIPPVEQAQSVYKSRR